MDTEITTPTKTNTQTTDMMARCHLPTQTTTDVSLTSSPSSLMKTTTTKHQQEQEQTQHERCNKSSIQSKKNQQQGKNQNTSSSKKTARADKLQQQGQQSRFDNHSGDDDEEEEDAIQSVGTDDMDMTFTSQDGLLHPRSNTIVSETTHEEGASTGDCAVSPGGSSAASTVKVPEVHATTNTQFDVVVVVPQDDDEDVDTNSTHVDEDDDGMLMMSLSLSHLSSNSMIMPKSLSRAISCSSHHTIDTITTGTKQQEHLLQHEQQNMSNAAITKDEDSAFIRDILSSTSQAHTPPTTSSSSYELRHFGKRPRLFGSSVPDRSRSASDLELDCHDDCEQKELLKHLIVSGDDDLQEALDGYDRGDMQPLQDMIQSGVLTTEHHNGPNHCSDSGSSSTKKTATKKTGHITDDDNINDSENENGYGVCDMAVFLGDLDLDFLHIDDAGEAAEERVEDTAAPYAYFGTVAGEGNLVASPPPNDITYCYTSPEQQQRRRPQAPSSIKSLLEEAEYEEGEDHQRYDSYNFRRESFDRARNETFDTEGRMRTNSLAYGIRDYSGDDEYCDNDDDDDNNGGLISQHQQPWWDRPSLPVGSPTSTEVTDITSKLGGGFHQTLSGGEDGAFVYSTIEHNNLQEQKGNKSKSKGLLATCLAEYENKKKGESNTSLVQEGGDTKEYNGCHGDRGTIVQNTRRSKRQPKTNKVTAVKKTKSKQAVETKIPSGRRTAVPAEEKRKMVQPKKKERKKQEQDGRKKIRKTTNKSSKKKHTMTMNGSTCDIATLSSSATNKNKETSAVSEGTSSSYRTIETGTGRPRCIRTDPNLNYSLDEFGLVKVERPKGWVGAYSPESRVLRIARFLEKRNHRVWTKSVKYNVRKDFADGRLRVKGRFVKKEDELLMRELMSLT